jgi:hypothetical protein
MYNKPSPPQDCLEFYQEHLIKEISFYTHKIEECHREIDYAARQLEKLKYFHYDVQKLIDERAKEAFKGCLLKDITK